MVAELMRSIGLDIGIESGGPCRPVAVLRGQGSRGQQPDQA
jgi:hypothetical protein